MEINSIVARDSEAEKPEEMNWLWVAGAMLITALSFFLRFWQLDLKPFHHDEGVNGFFLTTLFRDGVYKYDPSNYHGPTLYYLSLVFSKIFGLENLSVRASVAIFGGLMVVLALSFRKYLGNIGSLAAALFLALSPGMVFISRYFIHEILFVFLSLAIVAGVLFFIEGRKPGPAGIASMSLLLFVCFMPISMGMSAILGAGDGFSVIRIGLLIVQAVFVILVMYMLLDWEEGRPIYLLLASASASLFFATKETAFITLGTMLIAILCVWMWRKIYGNMAGEIGNDNLSPTPLTWATFKSRLGDSKTTPLIIFAVVIIFAYVWLIFFTSFFSYWKGLSASFEAYAFWTKTGTSDHTQNGYLGYVKWLAEIEAPIAILSAIGIIIAFLKGRHRFVMFIGLWAFGLFMAYTIIAYKTPWLALSFILPMCLIAGYGINEMAKAKAVPQKGMAALLSLVAVGVLGYQTYDLNFVRYDDDRMPYVYAHSLRGFKGLLEKIDYYAAKSSAKKDATVLVASPDYWPMPWHMREYKNVNFFGKIIEANTAEMIVAKKDEQEDEVIEKYSAHYKYVDEYPLRPGIKLILLVRKDLAEPGAKELYELQK